MDISIMFTLVFFLTSIGITGVSYAQKAPSSDIDVLMQLELRNHDGKLISYVEGKKILKINKFQLNKFLDTLTDKQIVIIDGKKFEVIYFEKNIERFNRSHSFAIYGFMVPVEGKLSQVLLINNDAYQTVPGDYIKPKFTFVRPIA
jgi:hypothetical protein